ncbi:hypothetical protein I4U23_000138 [Adineta vaga]|nr:hypothetical protein I4U23_000138 [Adineta vaga]
MNNFQFIKILLLLILFSNSLTNANQFECDEQLSCGCSYQQVEFIQSEGHEAKPYSWSMIVSIRLNNKHLCSGSILNESYILTSASCLVNISTFDLIIHAGIHNLSDNNGIIRQVDQIYIHSDYQGIINNYINDIAILHISQPFDLKKNSLIKQTCLKEKSLLTLPSNIYPYNGNQLALIGWGFMNCDYHIQQNSLQQIEIYTGDYYEKQCYILEEHRTMQFCAGLINQTKVSCVADPGSPIFQWDYGTWKQIGIASYVIDCMPLKTLGIYTRTVEYNQWIFSIINEDSITSTTTQFPILYPCDYRLTCGCSPSPVLLTPSRIVGGENALESSWSMIVSLRGNDKNKHICGGSILSDSYILTAAHCVEGGSIFNTPIHISIVAGMTNLSDSKRIHRSVNKIYIHPDYLGYRDRYRHDIAILYLNESLKINTHPSLTKTCIHRVDPPLISHEYIKNGTRLSVIGWGATYDKFNPEPKILQQTEVFAIDNNDLTCRKAMNDSLTQFCAGLYQGGKDSCQGDSGGPIFQWTGLYWEQVGIVSHGDGCAVAGQPGVYTRLSYYYHWINNILKTNNEHLEPQIVSINETTIKPVINTSTIFVTSTTPTKNNANSYRKNHLFIFIFFVFLQMIILQ